MESGDTQLLAAGSDVLSSQHGSVGGGLVTVSLDLHATSDTADGLTATKIIQNVSLRAHKYLESPSSIVSLSRKGGVIVWPRPRCDCRLELSRVNEPEIGDVDEGVVEGGEDTSNAENELTYDGGVLGQ